MNKFEKFEEKINAIEKEVGNLRNSQNIIRDEVGKLKDEKIDKKMEALRDISASLDRIIKSIKTINELRVRIDECEYVLKELDTK